MGQNKFSRREAIAGAMAAGGVLLSKNALAANEQAGSRKTEIRFAHLTDMHVNDKRHAVEGYAKAVGHASSQPNLDFIVTGGDHVMDSLKTARPQVDLSWNLFYQGMNQTKLPVKHVIGNHDIFGWEDAAADAAAPEYGVKLALDQLKMASPFYSFDQGSWHFTVLDSMAKRGNGYYAEVSPEQMEWLKSDLASAKGKNICVFTHVPILSVTSLFFKGGKMIRGDLLIVSDNLMHRDVLALATLFEEAGVKLAISGHTHMNDRIDYKAFHMCATVQSRATGGREFTSVLPKVTASSTCLPMGALSIDISNMVGRHIRRNS